MNKTLKIFAIVLMAVVMICLTTEIAFAANINLSEVVTDVDNKIQGDTTAAGDLTAIAGKIVGLIQIASAVAAVVLVAVFGFKFILGSANEKADYQKSFIPLIVGVVVVFAATSIARLLFGLMSA